MLNDSLQPKRKYVGHLCLTPDTLIDTPQAYLKKNVNRKMTRSENRRRSLVSLFLLEATVKV